MSKLQPYGRRRADSKRDIQRILDSEGKNFVDVADTLNGFRHSPRVLDALRSFGVPERFLFDPRRASRVA